MTKNKKKNKHIYSDSKKNGLDVVVSSNYPNLHNPMKQIMALYHIMPSDWSCYISEIMYDKIKVQRDDLWEDPSYILNEINNIGVVKNIMKNIINEELYNPYVDVFPLYMLDEATRNLIRKKQKFIKKYATFNKNYMYKNFNIHICYNDNRMDFSLYHRFFDVVVVFNSYSIIVSISKETKEYFNLNKLFEQFDEMEPNKWEMNKSKTMLYVKKNNKTKFKIYDDEILMNNCLDSIIIKDADSKIENRTREFLENFE